MLNIAAGNPITGYNLTRSLRFRSSASAYLNRTVGAPTNNKIFTVSFWVKRGSLGSRQGLIGATNAGASFYWMVEFDAGNNLTIYDAYATGTTALTTTQVFRDPSAWYHIVVAVDTTQATASNRTKVYVNGSQVTSFSVSNYPSQNSNTYFNTSGAVASVGSWNPFSTPYYFDGYLTEINFIDGQALTPTSFGSYNSTTGVWQPARYTGTYGTNGFYLPFTDNSALTTSSNVGLGKDFSGNGNYWTTNNISITSGTTYDSMTDVPTLTSATAANFAVLNPLTPSFADTGSASITNGNLTVTGNNGYGFSSIAPSSSKWYFEVVNTSANISIGIWLPPFTHSANGYNNTNYRWFGVDGVVYNQAGTTFQSYNTYGNGDVIGVALDLVNGKLYFSKNNTWQGSSDPVAGTNAAISGLSVGWLFGVISNSANVANVNFGQRPFAYTPPTGYVALNTYNLPTSTILQGNTVMDATTYTGTGSTQSIINAAGFKPDFVWIKNRNNVRWHILTDSVRGTNSQLFSNDTAAQEARTDRLTAFNSNGFSVGSYTDVNLNADTFVGWQWQAGQGTTSSNTSGTITSTVSVNASAGFSVVTYTGTGANATVGHGLGVAPALVIVKARNQAYNWNVYSSSLASTQFLRLNTTDSVQAGPTLWNSTSPTSSVFSIGTSLGVNGSGDTHVAYCFAPIAGYSAFGSYTGNGSTDGTFVYTGFRPKFVLIKRTNTTSSWIIWDSVRGAYNLNNADLYPDLSIAEYASPTDCIDMLSNGFKLRATGAGSNGSGDTFIYACFAENPFKNALAR